MALSGVAVIYFFSPLCNRFVIAQPEVRVLRFNRSIGRLPVQWVSGIRMKGTKRFPWFEAVAFLLILLLALGSSLVRG